MKILFFISLLIFILYIASIIFLKWYYKNNFSILECVYIIGPKCECACVYQIGQEKIISIYKITSIVSYVLLFSGLIINIINLLKNKYKKVFTIISTIIYVFFIIRFFALLLNI